MRISLAETVTKKKRIFQIAKELNISHTEIIELLMANGIKVNSHMSPVDDVAYQLIIEEFEKERKSVDRYRKEKIRKVIHGRRFQSSQEKKQFTILMPEEQRKLEEKERKEAEEIKKLKEKEKAKKKAEEKKAKKAAKEKEKEKKKAKPKKLKLRKVDLSEIAAKIDSTRPRPKKEVEKEKLEPKEKISIDTTIRKTLAQMDTKTKKKKYKRAKIERETSVEAEEKVIKVQDFMSVQELASLLDLNPTDVITKCFEIGETVTMNQRLDIDTISLIVDEFGFRAEQVEEMGEDIFSLEDTEEDIEKAVPRAPVVTIMGHVDHGKTTLLDYIQNSNIVAGESGGITQQIGAYEVQLEDEKSVTFIDTPGHEAFTAMRARGAQVTDVVILIVAADDGVKPQTIEAIDHANAAKVPIVVAVNKIDKVNADPERVLRELSDQGILVEEWGGKYQSKEISAKTGKGIDDLLELLALETEILELKANPSTVAKGTVIDSRLDKGHGAIGTVLIQKGTLNIGDTFVCGNTFGKVRALLNERGLREKSAKPSNPIQVLGFENPAQAGDLFTVISDEKKAKRIADDRARIHREIERQRVSTKSLDQFSKEVREGLVKTLPMIIKADVDGSIEALVDAFSNIRSEEVKIDVIHTGVGMISESDVLLASASEAIIIGFSVKTNSNAKLLAKNEGIEIRLYDVIYDVVNEIKMALEGLLEPEVVEETLGRAEVQTVFKISKLGFIAGSQVIEGKINRNDKARVIRDDEVIYEGTITSLKRYKEDIKEVKEGKECGIGIDNVDKFQEGDIIITYAEKKIKQTLS